MNAAVNLLDAHCHFDLMKDPAAVAAQADEAGIVTIAVTNAPSVFIYTQTLCHGFKHLRAALGLHPELVVSHHGELSKLTELLPTTHFVGEVGLDFVTTDSAIRDLQRRVFRSIVDACAAARGKVMTVHSRRACTAVLDEIGQHFPGVVILHWFSGTKKELRRAIDAGCYFSVNLSMLNSKSGQALIEEMPCERVLTETDGPFATVKGSPATPLDIRQTIGSLSLFWKCDEAKAREMVSASFSAAMKTRERLSI